MYQLVMVYLTLATKINTKWRIWRTKEGKLGNETDSDREKRDVAKEKKDKEVRSFKLETNHDINLLIKCDISVDERAEEKKTGFKMRLSVMHSNYSQQRAGAYQTTLKEALKAFLMPFFIPMVPVNSTRP